MKSIIRTKHNLTTPSHHSAGLHRFAVATAACTLVLIVIGGLVTSHGVGMAVPDWPNTYGYNMFLFPVSKWIGGVLYEHSHRLVASLVGLLVTILAGWIWARETRGRARWAGVAAIFLVIVLMGIRSMPVYVALAAVSAVVMVISLVLALKKPGTLRWWGVLALAAVILQGVLGGLRVVWIQDELGIFHGTLAQLFFVLMCSLALFTSRFWAELPKIFANSMAGRVLTGATVLILIQLVLGASMRHQHAGLAIPDFPKAYGTWWPATDAASVERYNQQRLEITAVKPITAVQIYLQMAHRIVAGLILAAVTYAAWATRRHFGSKHYLTRLAFAWLGLIVFQAFLGAWTIWSNKAADVATLHVLAGASSLALGALMSILAYRCPAAAGEVAEARVQGSMRTPFLAKQAASTNQG